MLEIQAAIFVLSQLPHILVLACWFTQQLFVRIRFHVALHSGALHVVVGWQGA
ncbi:hypothetical protein [Deinococcus arenicola]|uniref:Uncharacterized protein n=1 Tax=Deinococcus arenicola TaxID=2994950 RepID=A0ABU4DNY0_9DEIO|nr:hypothetical protein [Deinococcus sp. ZS9-10]MDV6373672.1 hypothetical protein [Deinococcus sp. ZS9-10]